MIPVGMEHKVGILPRRYVYVYIICHVYYVGTAVNVIMILVYFFSVYLSQKKILKKKYILRVYTSAVAHCSTTNYPDTERYRKCNFSCAH